MYTYLIAARGLLLGSLSKKIRFGTHVHPVPLWNSNWQCSQFLPRFWHVH